MSDTGAKPVRPIIVIKKKAAHGGHHGGAWKVAYADFVTAMMSLFIVLWLLNSTPQIKKAVAGYFNDPRGTNKETGSAMTGTGTATAPSVTVDKQNVEKIKEEIQKAILKQADLTKLSRQVEITITDEGLKIELIEEKGGTFFESGSPLLSPAGTALLNLIANQLKILPNRLLIEGHTDAQAYAGGNGYTNWELSSDRANSARRVLQQGGVGPNQISQVRGYADQLLRTPSNPLDPSNRRISLIVQWATAGTTPPPALPASTTAAHNDTQPTPAAPAPGSPEPQSPLQTAATPPPQAMAHLATPQQPPSFFTKMEAHVPASIIHKFQTIHPQQSTGHQ